MIKNVEIKLDSKADEIVTTRQPKKYNGNSEIPLTAEFDRTAMAIVSR